MARADVDGVLSHLRRASALLDGADRSDGQLLEQFLAGRDPAAFEALVRRHGPMVLGVCRRVLGQDADAADAFQATFLVLVRKAGSIVPRSQVGNWLYGVAHQTARKARAMNARRRARERHAPPPTSAPAEEQWRRLEALLDEELARLPEAYRAAVVLCELEGVSVKEAARRLGCPAGTAASRLSRGRALLAERLGRHGLALSAGGLAALLAHNAASAGVPAALLGATVRAGALVAAGRASLAAAAPATVAALTEGVLKVMLLSRIQGAAVLLLAAAAVTVTIWQCHRAWADGPVQVAAVRPAADDPKKADDPEPKALLERALKEAIAIKADKDQAIERKARVIEAVAWNLSEAGDKEGSAKAFVQAREELGRIEMEFLKASALGELATRQAEAGQAAGAFKTLEAIKVEKDGGSRWVPEEYKNRVQQALAERHLKAGELSEALLRAEKVDKGYHHRDELLLRIGQAQVKAKDLAAARKTAEKIEGPWFRSDVLVAVALAEGRAGDRDAALKTLQDLRRRTEAEKGERRHILPYVYLQAASVQAQLGDAKGALEWIERLREPEYKAEALRGLSAGLRKGKGDSAKP
jgi:RNA polymerase sigma factor (sigma-70 family)